MTLFMGVPLTSYLDNSVQFQGSSPISGPQNNFRGSGRVN